MASVLAFGAGRFDRAHPGPSRQFVQPRRPGFWVYLALMAVSTTLLVLGFALHAGSDRIWLVGGIWALWTWAAYWLVCRADLLEVVPTGIRLAALAWGVGCVTYSGPLDGWIERSFPIDSSWSDAIYAPPPEDGLKLIGVILIATIVPHVLRRRMGAVMVGMLVGLGFTFIENWFQANAVIAQGNVSDLAEHMLTRATLGAQSHLVFAAVAALGVWYFLAHPRRHVGWRVLVALACFIAGMLLHAAHDAASAMIAVISVQVLEIGVLAALIWWARRGEREWVIETTAGGLPPLSAEDGRVLASRRARRSIRHEARSQSSTAASAVTARQHTQLAYLNAIAADTDEHTLDQMRRQLADTP